MPDAASPLTRRAFTAAVSAAAVSAQNPAVEDPLAPHRYPPLREDPPFAGPLTFRPSPAALAARPFPLSAVRLLPGPFLRAAQWNRAYMARLDPSCLVHNFLRNAGLPSTATPLGGWESPNSELRGHFTGHYLSACALQYASSGDRDIKARGDQIVSDLLRCQAALGGSGYLSAFPTSLFDRLQARKPVWAPFYTLHKIMAGLLDMHVHAGSRDALTAVTRLAGWVDAWSAALPEDHMQAILKTEYGGMNDVLYALAGATGDTQWARTGDRFNKKVFFTPLLQRRDELRGLHANTHIPQVLGAALRYQLSSDTRFRDAASFFFDTIAAGRTYSPGGSGNGELWLTHPGRLALELRTLPQHQECCCAYNMMKLARRLYSWTASPRYFDYYERNLFNHRLGAIQPETGHSIYFLSLAPGAWKTLNTEDRTFWCCTGSALEEFARLNDSIYYHDAAGVFVNLFIASELDASGQGIRLRQETSFPEQPGTTLRVLASPNTKWTLRLRVPSWTPSPTVRLNGRELESAANPGSYLVITRVWKKGDRVDLQLPLRLTAEPTPDDPGLQSFLYGPIVLAAALGKEGLTEDLVRNRQGPEVGKLPLTLPPLPARGGVPDWLQPTGTDPLTFRAGDVTFKPLYTLWERFAVYWQV